MAKAKKPFKSKKYPKPIKVNNFKSDLSIKDMKDILIGKFKTDTPEPGHFKNYKPKNNHKVMLRDDSKPYVKAVEGDVKVGPQHLKLPRSLSGKLTQEQYEELADMNFDACEKMYERIKLIPQVLVDVIDEFKKHEEKLPYLTEVNKYANVCAMGLSDRAELLHELEEIRNRYKHFVGKVPNEDQLSDHYFLEMIVNVKTQLWVCSNRMTNALQPTINHLKDFYTSMVLRYWWDPVNRDNAPEDVKKFFKEQLHVFTGFKEKTSEAVEATA